MRLTSACRYIDCLLGNSPFQAVGDIQKLLGMVVAYWKFCKEDENHPRPEHQLSPLPIDEQISEWYRLYSTTVFLVSSFSADSKGILRGRLKVALQLFAARERWTRLLLVLHIP